MGRPTSTFDWSMRPRRRSRPMGHSVSTWGAAASPSIATGPPMKPRRLAEFEPTTRWSGAPCRPRGRRAPNATRNACRVGRGATSGPWTTSISRRIVDKAKDTGRTIALEDLTGIRDRTKVRKGQRYRQHSWSFLQLRQFIAYEAQDAGVPVILIDPADTSKICHVCGQLGQRDALIFSCTTFGDCDADINASLNISARDTTSGA
jgi:IS605 OrfB family transposase